VTSGCTIRWLGLHSRCCRLGLLHVEVQSKPNLKEYMGSSSGSIRQSAHQSLDMHCHISDNVTDHLSHSSIGRCTINAHSIDHADILDVMATVQVHLVCSAYASMLRRTVPTAPFYSHR
jgi:hypothetical protein